MSEHEIGQRCEVLLWDSRAECSEWRAGWTIERIVAADLADTFDYRVNVRHDGGHAIGPCSPACVRPV